MRTIYNLHRQADTVQQTCKVTVHFVFTCCLGLVDLSVNTLITNVDKTHANSSVVSANGCIFVFTKLVILFPGKSYIKLQMCTRNNGRDPYFKNATHLQGPSFLPQCVADCKLYNTQIALDMRNPSPFCRKQKYILEE